MATVTIVYQDSYSDYDSTSYEDDEYFSVPNFDDVSRGADVSFSIEDDGGNTIEEGGLFRDQTYVLHGEDLYAVVGHGRRRREIPWRDFMPDW